MKPAKKSMTDTSRTITKKIRDFINGCSHLKNTKKIKVNDEIETSQLLNILVYENSHHSRIH